MENSESILEVMGEKYCIINRRNLIPSSSKKERKMYKGKVWMGGGKEELKKRKIININ